MKKKIYVFDEYISSQKNGIGSYLRELLYCMKQMDVDICVLIFDANVAEFNILEEEGVEKMLFPPFLSGNFADNAEIIDTFLRLYISDSSNNVFLVNHSPCEHLLSLIKSSHPQSKLVFTIHGLGWTPAFAGDVEAFKRMILQEEVVEKDETDKWIINSYQEERKMYALADRVICLSQDTFDLLQDTYLVPSDKIAFIPNGLRKKKVASPDTKREELRQKLCISANDKVLLFSGRPTAQKGTYALLQAFDWILEEEPDARLIIAGFDNGSNMEKLITLASAHANRVTFTGLINRERLSEWYSAADVGVIPSYYDQCPYTGIEMMMHGLPVVASATYSLQNMFQDGLNARMVEIGNRENQEEFAQNLATAILELLASDNLRKKLSEGAETVFQSTYHVRYMEKSYQHLLDSL